MKLKFIFTILNIIFILQSCGSAKKLDTFVSNDEIYSSINSENLKIFKKIIKKYDINARNKEGRTLLMEAALLNKSIEIVKYLINENADVNAQDNYDNTALIFALEEGKDEIVKILLENGKDINVNLKPKEKRPFLLACKDGDFDNVKLLIEKGINYKEVDLEGRNALLTATFHQNRKIAEYLIDNIEVDINTQDNNGNTALMMSSGSDVMMDYVEFLIKKGADLNIVNNENKTALDIALEYENRNAVYNNSSVIHMLKKAGAKRASELYF